MESTNAIVTDAVYGNKLDLFGIYYNKQNIINKCINYYIYISNETYINVIIIYAIFSSSLYLCIAGFKYSL